MDTDGGNPRNITNNPDADKDPSWSPDGKRIAFVSDREGQWDIHVMDADGGNPRNLSNNDFDEWDPSWSPDGKRILFLSSADIYVMDADGGNPKSLTSGRRHNEFAPSWSPDGKRILFVCFAEELGQRNLRDGRRWGESAKHH